MARSRFGFTVANAGDLDTDGNEGTLRLVHIIMVTCSLHNKIAYIYISLSKLQTLLPLLKIGYWLCVVYITKVE